MDLSVVICTFNRAERLRTALASLRSVHVPRGLRWEVIVVDNASGDETAEVVRAAASGAPPVRYVHELRRGKSYALNTGIHTAQGTIIAFADDDVIFDRAWLIGILEPFAQPGCAGAGGRIAPLWMCPPPSWLVRSERPPWIHLDGASRFPAMLTVFDHGDEVRVLPYASPPWGANMAFRREMFVRYGSFRTDLGPPIADGILPGEDTEFGQRLMRAGETILYAAHAVVYHPVDSARLSKKAFRQWYYRLGRSSVRIGGVPTEAVRYLGVPRYLLRELGEALLRWLLHPQPRWSFYQELNVCWLAGQIAESYGSASLPRPRSISSV